MATKRTPGQVTGQTKEASSKGPIKVWSSLSITLQLRDYESIKFEHGQERFAKNGTQAEIDRVEQEIHEICEGVINKRVKKYARLIKRLREES